jgi:two-component system sensor histidine kinase PhcS
VKTIVSDLRAFAHREESHIESVNAVGAVQSALRFLSHEWKNQVEVTVDLAPDFQVIANRNKLIQVLVNLIQNSLDAFKRNGGSEEPVIRISGSLVDGRARLVIRDNGEGIDAVNLGKVFDPFFTTKEVGQGMGLGLSICYRIMESFKGRISVSSERGKFCEFVLEFPADAAEVREETVGGTLGGSAIA